MRNNARASSADSANTRGNSDVNWSIVTPEKLSRRPRSFTRHVSWELVRRREERVGLTCGSGRITAASDVDRRAR